MYCSIRGDHAPRRQGYFMFEAICNFIAEDQDYPERTRKLDILKRVLEGTLYDGLPYEFHDERTGGGEYIPLRLRKPSVRYGLPRIVVEDSVALLFSEGHFPTFDCADEEIRGVLADIVKECRLNEVMVDAAIRGSVGSVALLMRVLRGRLFVSTMDTLYLTPRFDPLEPDALKSVTEKYKVRGSVLAADGYDISDLTAQYWFMRVWDQEWERWFQPWPVGGIQTPSEDKARSTRHGLGFVPIVWVRNLPGGDAIDGNCTFKSAVDTTIEIDYQLSQAGRGLKYSSDPTLLIKEPAGIDGEMVRGAANALVLSEKGDAKLLEIGGTASQAVIEYVRTLREFALESVHGNRADVSKLSAATSGKALELMSQGLVWLADNLRVSYGEGALLSLARMILRASHRFTLKVQGRDVETLDISARISLTWPRWFAQTAQDREADARTLSTLSGAGQISRETALKSIADTYDIENVGAEIARINAEGKTHDGTG